VGGMDDIALIDEAKTDASAERRVDGGVAELGLGIVDRGLIPLDLSRELIDRRLLRVDLLARGEILTREVGEALEVELRVLQARLVLRFLGGRLIERGPEGARVDLDQKITFLDDLAFLEGDLGDLAVDAA